MNITGRAGTSLILRVGGYQFPAGTGELDDQWLMITGRISLSGRSWAFADPCLMLGEARELARWLHAAAAGRVLPQQLPAGPDAEWAPELSFIEPVLAFTLGSGSSGLVLRVNVSLEAAPPWARNDERAPWGHPVDLWLTTAELEQAANEWSQELRDLPLRSPARENRPERP